MRAGRGAGCVDSPVRPVGMLGSRYFDADLTVANSRELERILSEVVSGIATQRDGDVAVLPADFLDVEDIGAWH